MIINKNNYYDVIVVGGGHAGIEASNSSSKIKLCRTLLLTNNLDTIGQMSCNPSIGGIGKSNLVKEIDAIGGLMGISADISGIQFKKLNTSKGPSVQATRVQSDKNLYKSIIKNLLYKRNNLDIFQQKVIDIIINKNFFKIKTESNLLFYSKCLILTLGTFLNGKIYIGLNKNISGGRYGDSTSSKLSNKFKNIFLNKIKRFKTGTPPRIDKRSINFSILEKQYSDFPIPTFSFVKNKIKFLKQIPCYITKTNEITHEIIKNNINKSPIYNNLIKSEGPRYCPSIEDKIFRFNKNSHQIFLEPEGLYSNEIYPNGISTSLPINIQIKIINSICGLEKSKIIKPGYAIEYDFFDPTNLKLTLESKIIPKLFFAGQINGTTGYEEAAAQGIIAGINASRLSKNMDQWYPSRKESYIGVMLDDLCNKGVNEPYRMFTSRSEYRLYLREDNADIRLTEIGYKLGLIDLNRWKTFSKKVELIEREKNRLKNTFFNTKNLNIKSNYNKLSGFDLLKNRYINFNLLCNNLKFKPLSKNKDIYIELENQIIYQFYIKKQDKEIEDIKKYLNIELSENINFNNISGLSNETLYNLSKFKPKIISELFNISGITYSSILIIINWLKKNKLINKLL